MSNEVATTDVGMMQGVIKSGGLAIAQTRELSEALAAVQMAKLFPRDMQECRKMIESECQREGLAEVATYTYARGGQDITGPSIRLAETLVRCLGNIDAGWRELETSPESSKCEAFAWDKERNIRHSVTFTVSHIRHTRKGDYILTDPRDIYEKCANEAARRKRAAILAVVSGDLVEYACKLCDDALKAKADITPERLEKMLKLFEGYGVSRNMIEKRIQRDLQSITPAQFVSLIKVANSLKDGLGKVENYFEVETVDAEIKPEDKNNLRAALAKKKIGKTAEAEAEAAKEPEAAAETVEVQGDLM